MGRSPFDGVSDGEWSVFAEKVVAERDALRQQLAEAREQFSERANRCEELLHKLDTAENERDEARRERDAEAENCRLMQDRLNRLIAAAKARDGAQ